MESTATITGVSTEMSDTLEVGFDDGEERRLIRWAPAQRQPGQRNPSSDVDEAAAGVDMDLLELKEEMGMLPGHTEEDEELALLKAAAAAEDEAEEQAEEVEEEVEVGVGEEAQRKARG